MHMVKESGLRKGVATFMREIVFGLEDSLVSTLGAVVGIAAGAQNRFIVILSGLVLIAVESISMAAGSYLSSKNASEAEETILREEGSRRRGLELRPIRAALVMGLFYLLGGSIPLLPFLFLPLNEASVTAVVITGCTLFAVGIFAATISKRSKLRGGFQMLIVSLSAALVGYLIGNAAANYLPTLLTRV